MPDGRAPRAGEIFFNEPLGRSLELIAASKGEAFYRSELAARVVRFAGEHGAALTLDDLATHTADWCGTISTRFRDVDLHEIPPNGQGIAALRSEEHTSELQSLMRNSYAVFCLKKKNITQATINNTNE